MNPIKVVVVGGACVGKTFITERLVYNEIPVDLFELGEVFEAHETTFNHEGVDLSLIFQDTQGQEEYLLVTRLQYPGTRVFMVCFAINEILQDGFDGSSGWTDWWIDEIKKHAAGTPIILLGCKKDKATNECLEMARNWGTHKVNQLLEAKKYVECSAYTGAGVVDILEAVIEASASSPSAPETLH